MLVAALSSGWRTHSTPMQVHCMRPSPRWKATRQWTWLASKHYAHTEGTLCHSLPAAVHIHAELSNAPAIAESSEPDDCMFSHRVCLFACVRSLCVCVFIICQQAVKNEAKVTQQKQANALRQNALMFAIFALSAITRLVQVEALSTP